MDESQRRELAALDEALGAVPLPSGLPERIATSIEARSTRRASRGVLLLATAAVALAFVVGRGSVSPRSDASASARPSAQPIADEPTTVATPRPQPLAAATPLWDGRLGADDACVITGANLLSVSGDCRLRLREPALELEVWRDAQLEPAEHGVRLRSGTAMFHVETVAPGSPRVRIEVAAGAIEVIGTRFAVSQSEQGGHVDLLEGAIAFVDREGTTHAIAAGQRLAWEGSRVRADAVASSPASAPASGPASSPASSPGSSPAARRPSKPTTAALDEALDRVAGLRRSGRYREAIEVLVTLRRSIDDDADVAAVLSYEEGTLRARVDRPDAVCAYWRGHLARFGAGDHATSIAEEMDAAGCGAP